MGRKKWNGEKNSHHFSAADFCLPNFFSPFFRPQMFALQVTLQAKISVFWTSISLWKPCFGLRKAQNVRLRRLSDRREKSSCVFHHFSGREKNSPLFFAPFFRTRKLFSPVFRTIFQDEKIVLLCFSHHSQRVHATLCATPRRIQFWANTKFRGHETTELRPTVRESRLRSNWGRYGSIF